jgi:hypothetical protein
MRVYPSHPRITKPPYGALVDWSNPLTRGLVAYWPTNEFCWGPNSVSASGVSRTHQISSSGGGATWAPGRNGSPAWSFASSNYAWTGSNSDFDLSIGAIFLWFRTTQASNPIFLHGRHDFSNSFNGITIYIDTGSNPVSAAMKATASPGGGCTCAGSITGMLDGNWHMVALNFSQANGDTCELYTDGRLSATATNGGSWAFNNQDLRWGKALDNFWTALTGQIDFGGWFNRKLSGAEWQQLYEDPYGWFQPPAIKRYNKLWIFSTFNNSLALPATTGYTTLTGQSFTNIVTLHGTTGFTINVGNWFNTLTLSAVTTLNSTLVTGYAGNLTLHATTGWAVLQGIYDVSVIFAPHAVFNINAQQVFSNTITLGSVTSMPLDSGAAFLNVLFNNTTAFNVDSAFVQNVSLTLSASTSGGYVLEVIHVGVVDATSTLHFTQFGSFSKTPGAHNVFTPSEAASVQKILNQLATSQLVFAQLTGRTSTFVRTVSQVFPVKQGSTKPIQIIGAPVVTYYRPAAFVHIVPKKSFLLLQAPGWNVALPNPELGDTQDQLGKVVVKRSINNGVYSYIKRSELQKLSYTIRMTRNKSLELQAFVDANIANAITLTTYQGEVWIVKITNNPIDFVPKDRWYPTRERVDVTIDFTGVRVF